MLSRSLKRVDQIFGCAFYQKQNAKQYRLKVSNGMKTGDIVFYIGTYTDKTSRGIYGFRFDPVTGECTDPELLAEMVSPSYLLMNNSRTVLYAVSEPTDESRGSVAAFAVDPVTGRLNKINEVEAPGKGLCHIALDKQERYLFTVCYSEATVQVYSLREDGSIGDITCIQQHFGRGVHPYRQEKPHPHATCLTPDERYLCVCDLGIDRLVVYRFYRETGKLERDEGMTLSLPPGCGPRHMIFHPSGKYAYVVTELSSQVIALSYDADIGFTVLQVINALQDERCDSAAAAIRIGRGGKHLYTSNRGEDSIAQFDIDMQTGKLERICNTPTQGKHPRDFILDESGSYLVCVNQNTDNILIYDVNQQDGTLSPRKEVRGISMPVCVVGFELSAF